MANAARGGSILINLIHEIDFLRFTVGEITAVEAIASNRQRGFAVSNARPIKSMPAHDIAAAASRYAIIVMLVCVFLRDAGDLDRHPKDGWHRRVVMAPDDAAIMGIVGGAVAKLRRAASRRAARRRTGREAARPAHILAQNAPR